MLSILGHFFWQLNPKTKRAGPARRITEELGIPSPIDTAFTRCNCQGKTYIIKVLKNMQNVANQLCLQPLKKKHRIVHFPSLRVTTTGVLRMVLRSLDIPDRCPRTLVGSPGRSLLLCQSQPPERSLSLCTSSRKVLSASHV